MVLCICLIFFRAVRGEFHRIFNQLIRKIQWWSWVVLQAHLRTAKNFFLFRH